MAIVRELELLEDLGRARHTEAKCTYTIFRDADGKKWLQVDTYGSDQRKIRGKKSQSVRFAPEAISQLRGIIGDELTRR